MGKCLTFFLNGGRASYNICVLCNQGISNNFCNGSFTYQPAEVYGLLTLG